jgi:S1-C subfamily serine protease
MSPRGPGSRVSRETRLLLLTLLLSVVALLVLARVRFPGRPSTPALVPPLLTQLGPSTPFEDLSNAVSALEAEVAPSLQLLTIESSPAAASRVLTALRLRPDAAVALVGPTDADPAEGDVVARDRATGLAIVRTPLSPAPGRPIWTPQREAYPRYLLVTEASPTGTSLRPVFVGPLRGTTSHVWETPVWIIPDHLHVPRGAFAFTSAGAFVGLVVDEPDSQALVPAGAVMVAAERLMTTEQRPPGTLGVEVQKLTAPVAAAARVSSGVVVVHVEDGGPAADQLVPTDVIETLNDRPVVNPFQWNARIARVAAGESVVLRIRRGGQTREVGLTATDASSSAPTELRLGLAMRARAGVGAEVTLVHAASAGDRAGIAVGDVITRVGALAAPGPAQVIRAYEALPAGGALLVAVSRGTEHLVLALAKP